MHFDIEVYKGDIHLDPDTAILPGERLRITVEADEPIKGMKIEIFDPNGNMRMMSRRKGNTGEFSTQFPQTRTYGQWKITVTARSMDGDIEEDTEIIRIDSKESEIVSQAAEIETVSPEDETTTDEMESAAVDIDEKVLAETSDEPEDMEEETSEHDELQPIDRIGVTDPTDQDELDEVIEAMDETPESDIDEEEKESMASQVDELDEDDGDEVSEEEDDEDDEEAQMVEDEDEQISSGDLKVINGVGKATEIKLNMIGITTIEQLAEAVVVDLVEAGINIDQARQIIEAAQDFLA